MVVHGNYVVMWNLRFSHLWLKNTAFWSVLPCSVVEVYWYSFGTSLSFYHTTQHHIPEDSTRHDPELSEWEYNVWPWSCSYIQSELTCGPVLLQLRSCCRAESSLLMRIKQSDSNCGPGMATKWTLCLWIGETSKKCFTLLLTASFLLFAIYFSASLAIMF
jgi:hypothetical protein